MTSLESLLGSATTKRGTHDSAQRQRLRQGFGTPQSTYVVERDSCRTASRWDSPKRDNLIDVAGYVKCLDMIDDASKTD